MECFFAFAAELAGRGNRSLAADIYIYTLILGIALHMFLWGLVLLFVNG